MTLEKYLAGSNYVLRREIMGGGERAGSELESTKVKRREGL